MTFDVVHCKEILTKENNSQRGKVEEIIVFRGFIISTEIKIINCYIIICEKITL